MPSWFVAFSLFFPRLTLFATWIFHAVPVNDTPLFIDAIGFIIAPRLLIAAWLWSDPAWGLPWALLFGVASVFAGGGQAEGGRRSWRRARPSKD